MLARTGRVVYCNRVIRKTAPSLISVPRGVVASIVARHASSLIPFKLADIGEGIAEVELMKWYVKVRHI